MLSFQAATTRAATIRIWQTKYNIALYCQLLHVYLSRLSFNFRCKDLDKKGILYVGSGVSGGEEGARYGPSLMPGGNAAAWPQIKDIFQVNVYINFPRLLYILLQN